MKGVHGKLKGSVLPPALFSPESAPTCTFLFFLTCHPPVNKSDVAFPCASGCTITDLQIMVAQVATEADAVLEIIDTVPRVELGLRICDVECCRLGICGVKPGICVVLVVEKGTRCSFLSDCKNYCTST